MSTVGYGQKATYVGQTVAENRGVLVTSRPINNGIVTDWDAMEHFWFHMYYDKLMTPSEEHGILHTEPVDNPPANREKLIELMFEQFGVPSTALVTTSTLALYASGVTTGLVVESGFDETRVVPVYEGIAYLKTERMPVGGRHVTQYMIRLLNDRGFNFTTPKDWDIARTVKEEQCYSALDFQRELAESFVGAEEFVKSDSKQYRLPDGSFVQVRSEAFRAPEILFNPGLFNIESKLGGVHEIIFKALTIRSIDEYKDMPNNIVLAGGNTLFPRLQTRLENVLKSRIIANPERRYAAWIGGSVMASAPDFQRQCISKDEYFEHGTQIVHSKCFM
uniref:Actin n=1 Tax=Sipha flava TaxID=143950 RepID=A0A2S2QS00_9HEMI